MKHAKEGEPAEKSELCKRLRKFRLQADVPQQKVADALGITKSMYSNWETGRTGIPVTAIPALARYYKVTTDELLGVDPEEVSNTLIKRVKGLSPMQQEALEKMLDAIMYPPKE